MNFARKQPRLCDRFTPYEHQRMRNGGGARADNAVMRAR